MSHRTLVPIALALLLGVSALVGNTELEADLAQQRAVLANARFSLNLWQPLVDEIREDILQTDQRIEHRVGWIVDILAQASDAAASDTRSTRAKREAIEGLAKAVEQYQSQREQMPASPAPRSDSVRADEPGNAAADVDKLFDKRIEAIVSINQSLVGGSDYARYRKWRNRSNLPRSTDYGRYKTSRGKDNRARYAQQVATMDDLLIETTVDLEEHFNRLVSLMDHYAEERDKIHALKRGIANREADLKQLEQQLADRG